MFIHLCPSISAYCQGRCYPQPAKILFYPEFCVLWKVSHAHGRGAGMGYSLKSFPTQNPFWDSMNLPLPPDAENLPQNLHPALRVTKAPGPGLRQGWMPCRLCREQALPTFVSNTHRPRRCWGALGAPHTLLLCPPGSRCPARPPGTPGCSIHRAAPPLLGHKHNPGVRTGSVSAGKATVGAVPTPDQHIPKVKGAAVTCPESTRAPQESPGQGFGTGRAGLGMVSRRLCLCPAPRQTSSSFTLALEWLGI